MFRYSLIIFFTIFSGAHAQTTTNAASQQSPVVLEAGKVLVLATDATKDRNIPESKRAEYFANVSSLRKQIARIIPELTTKIAELEKEKIEVDEKISKLQEEIGELSELQKKDKEELEREVGAKNVLLQRLQNEIKIAQDQLNKETDESKKNELGDQIRELRRRVLSFQRELRNARNDLERHEQAASRLPAAKEELMALRTHRVFLEYEQAKNVLRGLQNQRDTLDDYANSLLDIEKARNEFTLWATAAFSGLVGAVIVLFFLVLLLYSDVRANVFTGDAAIQFVTIFSLVIAIILFGVLRILEGKELAALLGGLSGYILGRGTISRNPSQPGAQGNAPLPPVAAPPPAVTP